MSHYKLHSPKSELDIERMALYNEGWFHIEPDYSNIEMGTCPLCHIKALDIVADNYAYCNYNCGFDFNELIKESE